MVKAEDLNVCVWEEGLQNETESPSGGRRHVQERQRMYKRDTKEETNKGRKIEIGKDKAE